MRNIQYHAIKNIDMAGMENFDVVVGLSLVMY
jgi:hypothetical protein